LKSIRKKNLYFRKYCGRVFYKLFRKNLVGIDDISLTLDIDSTNILYRLTIATELNILFLDSNVSGYGIKKILHNVGSEMALNVDIVQNLELTKFLDVKECLSLISEIENVLIQLVKTSPIEMVMSCEVSAVLKHYRKLSEMDSHPLSDFDNMRFKVDPIVKTKFSTKIR